MILFDDVISTMNGRIRLLHAVPNAPAVDVYANGKLLYKNLAFGQVTDYIDVPVGKYKIQLYKAGNKNNLFITENYEVGMNSVSTVAVTYANNEISFFVLDDTVKDAKSFLSSVRFINLSPDSKLLSLRLPENKVLFDEVSYLETNEYYPLSAGIYNFVLINSDGSFEKYISNIGLEKGVYITIYIIGLFKGNPRVGYILVKD